MRPDLRRWLLTGTTALFASYLLPSVAVANETAPLPNNDAIANGETETAVAAPVETPVAPISLDFISDGAPVAIEELGIVITPPTGWQVQTNTGSLSYVLQEPKDEKPSYDKPKYRRNITVATIHEPSPIDEKRAQTLKEELTNAFAKDSLASDFTILEHKFFNYRGENDGLLIYSTLNLGQFPVMQMHTLVSGESKQFLLTYTDLAERFTQQDLLDEAWNSMVSLEVSGETPLRRDTYIRYGSIAGVFVALLLVMLGLRRKASRKDYHSEADELLADDDLSMPATSNLSTLHTGWKLRQEEKAENGDMLFTTVAMEPLDDDDAYASAY